jgi:hypothetical protein
MYFVGGFHFIRFCLDCECAKANEQNLDIFSKRERYLAECSVYA